MTQIKTYQFKENLNSLPAESPGLFQALSPGLDLKRASEINLIHQERETTCQEHKIISLRELRPGSSESIEDLSSTEGVGHSLLIPALRVLLTAQGPGLVPGLHRLPPQAMRIFEFPRSKTEGQLLPSYLHSTLPSKEDLR